MKEKNCFPEAPQLMTTKSKSKIPWYIIGFFLFSIIATFNIIPEIVSHTAHTISSQFEIIALAGIGMRVKFRDLVKRRTKGIVIRRYCRHLSSWNCNWAHIYFLRITLKKLLKTQELFLCCKHDKND